MKESTSKNLRVTVRSKLTRQAAVVGLLMGLSASLSACSGIVPQQPQSVAPVADTAKGSGVKVETADGSYEKITLDPNAPAYTYDTTNSGPMTGAGWSNKDGASGKRYVIDYVVKEFIDSSALEGGDKSYQKWHSTDAKKYFDGVLYGQIADGSGNVVLGNFAGKSILPSLINDGTPRSKNVSVESTGYRDFPDQPGLKGIEYSLRYSADYRVSDASAASFISQYTKLHLAPEKQLTPEQFLASKFAKPQLKDGKGENLLKLSGTANIVITKNASGAWVISGFTADPSFDTADFTQDEGDYFKTS